MTESIAFDRAADFYDETRGFPPGIAAQVGALLRDAGQLAPDRRVLDVGTGTGRIALPLGAHVGLVAGIDLSRPMLQRLLPKRTGQPVYPVEGDATRLPFPDDTFDAAVGVHVFHLIPGWQTALREIARVLKPEGVLLHGWNDTNHARSGEDMAALWAAWDAAVGSFESRNVGVTREDYATFLPDQGWRQLGEPHWYHYTMISTPQEFVDRLEGRVWSSMWRLDHAVIERGIAAVRATMHAEAIDPYQTREVAASFQVVAYAPPVRDSV